MTSHRKIYTGTTRVSSLLDLALNKSLAFVFCLITDYETSTPRKNQKYKAIYISNTFIFLFKKKTIFK